MGVTTDPRKTRISAAPTLLAASAVAVSVTGTTNETALATVAIPGGAMGLNGGLHIFSTWTYTNSANTKTMRGRLGGIAGTAFMTSAQTTTASHSDLRWVRNRGAANSQIGGQTGATIIGTSTNANVTGAINTSVGATYVLSGQLASAAETITLESYEVWLVP